MWRVLACAFLGISACGRSPCVEPGEYAFFGRRAVVAGVEEQGMCPETIEGTVTWFPDAGAAFRVAGFEGSCTRREMDLRPNYDVCSITLDCDGRSPSGLATLSLSTVIDTRSKETTVIAGFGDVGNELQTPAKWTQNDTVCVGRFAWAASRNP